MFNFLKKAPKPEPLNESKQKEDENNRNLSNFDIKHFTEQLYQDTPKECLYWEQLRSGKIKPKVKKSSSDEKIEEDVILLENENDIPESLKPKPFIFLQFHENIRPAYFGPTPRKPVKITPQNPFAKEEFLDYEYESDLEWDEGGPGESLSESDSEGEEKDDYEMDEFFVPHGYLSDDEIENQVESDDLPTDGREPADEEAKSKLKEKLQLKDKARLAEMDSKYKKPMQPQFISCLWENTVDCEKEKEKFDFLKTFSMIPIVYPSTAVSTLTV